MGEGDLWSVTVGGARVKAREDKEYSEIGGKLARGAR